MSPRGTVNDYEILCAVNLLVFTVFFFDEYGVVGFTYAGIFLNILNVST